MTVADLVHVERPEGGDTPARRACVALDAALFTTPVFTIDKSNQKVSGARTIAAARAAVARGDAATWAATLRSGVAAVDVDLDDDDLAVLVVSEVVEWCSRHSVWACARPSGGGPGRWHVLAVPADLSDELHTFTKAIRARLGLSPKHVDWRTTLRTLTAPHRVQGELADLGDAVTLLSELRESVRQPTSGHKSKSCREVVEPAEPIDSRTTAALSREFWKAIRQAHGPREDRSLTEFLHTRSMVRAGYDEDQAWAVIADSAHKGLIRSRVHGRSWWRKHVWNRVDRTTTSRSTGPKTIWHGTYDWALVLGLARGVRQVWDQWSTKQRHSIDHVAAVAADRVRRAHLSPVPLSLRSVVEDTGLDKNTVAAALRRLTDSNILVRVETYDYASDDGSGRKSSVYAPNLLAVDFRSPTQTPSPHTPPPATPHWLDLPAGSLSTWLSLALHGDRSTPGSTRTQELHHRRLSALHERSLIKKSRNGWSLSHRTRHSAGRSALARWAEMRRQHAQERAEFRELRALERSLREESWRIGREQVRNRRAASDLHRHASWFSSLSDDEQRSRKHVWTETWKALTPGERALRLDRLNDRRERAMRHHSNRALAGTAVTL